MLIGAVIGIVGAIIMDMDDTIFIKIIGATIGLFGAVIMISSYVA